MAVTTTRNEIVILSIILLSALLLRLAMIYILPPPEIITDAREYNEIAHSITEGKGYALKNGEPTAIRPPLYPLVY
jgi:hypothetical protein